MSRPKNLQETKKMHVTVNARTYGFLCWLAKNGIDGTSASDVAAVLIRDRINVLLAEKYHERAIPDASDTSPPNEE